MRTNATMRRSPSAIRFYAPLAFALVLTGCGQQRAMVTGQVFYKEKPLTQGRIMFQPKDGPAARGDIGSDGRFTMYVEKLGDGVPVGQQSVRVISRAEPPKDVLGEDKELPAGESLIPGKYGSYGLSGITLEVTPGDNQFIIRLGETTATVEKNGG